MLREKGATLTRFIGNYICGTWDFSVHTYWQHIKGKNSKLIQNEGAMTGKERDKHLSNFHSAQCGSTWRKLLRLGTIFNEGLTVFSEDRGTIFFHFHLALWCQRNKTGNESMEELGEVLLCDKQHPMGTVLLVFFRITCKHNSNTRVIFKILLGRFLWQFSSSDSVLSLQGAWGGSLVRKLRSHMLGFVFGFSVLSLICICVDWPRDCHTDWRKSEREKQISYNSTYMWNIQK